MSENKPWLSQYSAGIPVNIDTNKFPTLNIFFDECFKKYKNRVAFSNQGKEMTYGDVDKLSKDFAAYLQYRGLVPGDKMAIMMPNLLQYPIAMIGAIRAGIIVVNTNPLYTEREMLHQFTASDVKAIVIVDNFAAKLENILPKTQIKTVIIATIGEMLGTVKGAIVNLVVRHVKKLVPSWNIPNTVKFKAALAEGKGKKIESFPDEPDTVIFHQYTGGTTGLAKGAMLTNKNMIANTLQIGAVLSSRLSADEEAVMLTPLPLYHIFALTVNCFAMMNVGAHSILVTNPRDLNSISKEFKRYPISLMTGVNTLFNALLQNEKFKALDFSNLKITVAGGMALQSSVAKGWEKVTGCPNTEGYGMTESSPVASVNPIDGTGKLGSIGFPLPSTDMRIVDENKNPLGVGEIGEIQIKGPQVMKGYYNQPEETAATIMDGWLNTGDIGIMDDDGYFKIVDRKKDMIIVSGFNVYPNEIEDVIADHPKVNEVACIGIDDDHSGEVVKLFIVKADKSLSEKEIMEYSKKNLTGYKRPKAIEFRQELPKSTVGKILRKVLRDEEEAKKSS